MQLKHKTDSCDPQRLEAYLNDTLGEATVIEVEEHLATCADCREQLEQSAGNQEQWQRTQSLLRDDPFDHQPVERMFMRGECDADPGEGEAAMLSREIRGWLDPTDDPKSLGRFAGYEIVGIVGHGGMGIVLKGFEASLNRLVAIKVLAPRMATNGSARKRFAREAQATAAVRQDNVIAIHRVDEWHGLPFLVMPYVGGVSLQKRIDAEGPQSIEQTLRVGVQIAAGLAAAHAQGLVHRDIKPANILLEQGVERVTITDFGLARAADDASVTRTGVVAGTPRYMSPEQAEARPLDARSDLFSLGSLLYAMAIGRPPFRGEGSFEVLKRIVNEPARRMREIEPTVPEWFERLVGQLHAKSPDERLQSAEEVGELLRGCLAHVQQPDAVPLPRGLGMRPGKAKSKPLQAGRLPYRGSSMGILVTFAAVICGLLGAFLWLATTPPDISGTWTGEQWGQVILEERKTGKYDGTYSDTFGEEDGKLQLKWSRLEHRFKGTWREGKDRFGKIAVRLVDDEIRGAWTTNKKSAIDPGRPELADLVWVRVADVVDPPMTNEVAPKTVDSRSNADGEIIASWNRWDIRYPNNPRQFVRMLDFFDFEIGVVGVGDKEITYLSNVSSPAPIVRRGPPKEETRLYLTSAELSRFSRPFLEQAGIETGGRIVLLIVPKETGQSLAALESKFDGASIRHVKKTVFGVRPQNDGFEFYVVSQDTTRANESKTSIDTNRGEIIGRWKVLQIEGMKVAHDKTMMIEFADNDTMRLYLSGDQHDASLYRYTLKPGGILKLQTIDDGKPRDIVCKYLLKNNHLRIDWGLKHVFTLERDDTAKDSDN